MRLQDLRKPVVPWARLAGGIAIAAALAAGAASAAMPPDQVEYLPRDGAAIIVWSGVTNATGYNVYQQVVKDPAQEPTAPVKVNATPMTVTSLLVQNLQNGTAYHFTVTAIVDGQETEAGGPTLAEGNGGRVAVVPQKPLKLGANELYGLNIGTDWPGSYSVDANGVITMKASGRDIYGSGDGFYFLAVPVKGDVTVTARVVSGPTQVSGDDGGWEQGGPMIRESLDAEARMTIMAVMRTNPLQYKRRMEQATTPDVSEGDRGDNTNRPVWLRLVRKGDSFTAFYSNDGADYKQVGGPVSIGGFAQEAYVGLSFCGHKDGEYQAIVYDNFKITSP
jgi:regulation of enolase protein 1 (concanavalin A-like superfamily)